MRKRFKEALRKIFRKRKIEIDVLNDSSRDLDITVKYLDDDSIRIIITDKDDIEEIKKAVAN